MLPPGLDLLQRATHALMLSLLWLIGWGAVLRVARQLLGWT